MVLLHMYIYISWDVCQKNNYEEYYTIELLSIISQKIKDSVQYSTRWNNSYKTQ